MYMNKIKNPNLLLAWIRTDSMFWKKSLDMKGVCMCQAIQEIRIEEHNQGITQGITQGKLEQACESARNFYAMGIEIEKIARGLNQTVETVKQWVGLSTET